MNMLFVVDMQYPFVQAEDAAYVAEVVQLVKSARERGDLVCIIEDRHGNPTIEQVLAELASYSHVLRVGKSQWDGSSAVAYALNAAKFVPANITACGAYAEECVTATVAGLRRFFPTCRIELVKRACVPAPANKYGEDDWLRLGRLLSVELS